MTMQAAITQYCDNGEITARLLNTVLPAKNSFFLAHIIGAMLQGHSCLPTHLGLSTEHYTCLILTHFDASFADIVAEYVEGLVADCGDDLSERGSLRQSLLEMRRDEWNDVRNLLLAEINEPDEVDFALAAIVAAGCLGSGHLWRDLGFPSRTMLREMLTLNFPTLTRLNDRDMRWKKFFYKQLCEQEGSYVCRSPSCDSCSNFDDCFGEET